MSAQTQELGEGQRVMLKVNELIIIRGYGDVIWRSGGGATGHVKTINVEVLQKGLSN